MLVSRKHRKLLLNVRDPAKITTVIPTARELLYKGRTLTVVPHGVHETKVLNNLGITAPSPIRYYYKWPGRFPPFAAQVETADFLSTHTRAYCLSSMGVGKTLATLWAYDYLRDMGTAQRMLVVAPLSTLERTWSDEVFRNFPHLTATVLHGTAARRLKLLEQPADIYIINHDGMQVIADELAHREDIDTITLDELAVFRNARTTRWKTANTICNKQKPRRVWGLTGTPIPNAPIDAWAQCKLLTPDTVSPYFNQFRDRVMRQITQFKWAPREDALDVVHTAMQPSIRFTLEDCTDLPEQVFVDHDVGMTPEQMTIYREMASKLKAEFDGGQLLAVNEAVKAMKLLQIACGVAYGIGGEELNIPATGRLAVLDEVIEQSEGKVIVFVPFTGALNAVAEHVRQRWTASIIDGGVSKLDRDEIFSDFQKRDTPHVLVAQPATMSHGLTLTAATTIVWFAPINSNEIFEQANARVRRPGQKRTTVVVHLSGSHIERRMFERLKNKQSTQGVLLELVKEQGL